MKRSDAEKAKLIEEFAKRKEKGESPKDICTSFGITRSSLWNWQKKLGLTKSMKKTRKPRSSKPFIESIPLEPPVNDTCCLVIGSPQAIADLMKARGL